MILCDKTPYFDNYIFKAVVETKQVKKKAKMVGVLQKAAVERNLCVRQGDDVLLQCKIRIIKLL